MKMYLSSYKLGDHPEKFSELFGVSKKVAVMKKKDGSFVVLFRDDKREEVFLVHRSDWPIWTLTGGGIEVGETPKNAAIREAYEETGFKVKVLRKVGTYENIDPQTKNTTDYNYLFEGRVVSGDFKPEFPGCRGQWFKVDNLPSDVTNKTKQKITDAHTSTVKEFYKKDYAIQFQDNLHLLVRHPIASIKFFLARC